MMKLINKKIIYVGIAIVMNINLVGCGTQGDLSSNWDDFTFITCSPEYNHLPNEKDVNEEINKYLHIFEDESTRILTIVQKPTVKLDDKYIVQSRILYSGKNDDGKGVVEIEYEKKQDKWSIKRFSTELKAIEKEANTELNTAIRGVQNGYKLQKVGEVSVDKKAEIENGLVFYDDNNKVVPYASNIGLASSMNGYQSGGYVVINDEENTENGVGLVTVDGELLIEPSAFAIYSMPTIGTPGDSFMIVTYSAGQCKNKDKADAYYFDNQTSEIVYINTYSKIYNLKERHFLDNEFHLKHEEIDSLNTVLMEVGDNFIYQHDGYVSLCDSNGIEFKQMTGLDEEMNQGNVGIDYFILKRAGVYEVLDENGNWLMSSRDELRAVKSWCDYSYIKKETNEGVYLIDKNGNTIIDQPYSKIIGVNNDLVFVQNLLGKYQFLSMNGDVISEVDDSFYDCYGGLYSVTKVDGMYAIVSKNGEILFHDNVQKTGLTVIDNNKYGLVLNTGEFSLNLNDVRIPEDIDFQGLLIASSKLSGKYGAYDMFTGKQLLEFIYDEIINYGNMIFGKKDGVWEAFDLQVCYSN